MAKTDVNVDQSRRKDRDAEENQLDSAHIRGMFKNWIFELYSRDETTLPPPKTLVEAVKRTWMGLIRLMKRQKDEVTPTRVPGKRRRILLIPLIILIPSLSYLWAARLLSEFLSS